MTPHALLDWLEQRQVSLSLAGEQLAYDAPQGVMDAAILALLTRHKQAVIALLIARQQRRTADTTPPMSPAQQRLWFLDQLDPGNALYNETLALRFDGALHAEALAGSLEAIVARHATLRTTFVNRNGSPEACIAPPSALALPLIDVPGETPQAREAAAVRLLGEHGRQPFDLEAAPPLRAVLFKLAAHDHILLLTVHHIAGDGWSLGVLLRELAECYAALAQARPAILPPLPLQYADFAHVQQQRLAGAGMERQRRYWMQRLAGAPALLALPTDRPRPALATHAGGRVIRPMPAALAQRLQQFSQQHSVTLFMTLMAAFNALLYRYSAQRDLCIGFPAASRNDAALEGIIGLFVNPLVLRTRLDGALPFNTLLEQVRAGTLEAQAHQELPFEQLVEELKPERHLSHAPVFQVMFNQLPWSGDALTLPGLRLRNVDVDIALSKFDLTLTVLSTPQATECRYEFKHDLFDRRTIDSMAHHFEILLEGIVADPGRPVAALPLLAPAELARILAAGSPAPVARQATSVQQLFEAQADATPERTALVAGDAALGYRELNQRANQLAHRLRAQGVGPDVLVGLCAERGAELVLGMLAVLKAGGAYLPLDPAYPRQRLAHMVDDAQPVLVLTQQRLLPLLPSRSAQVFCLDSDWPSVAELSQANPEPVNLGLHLAYVIYTSGSTGKPKGVQVTHAAVVNFLQAMREKPGMQAEDTVLNVTSLSFDIAVLELLLPLICGARSILASQADAADPQQLAALLQRHDVTLMQATPSTWTMLTEAGWPALRQPLKVLCGGEALPPELAAEMLRHVPAVWNMYGPTETTVWSATQCLDQAGTQPRIGRPIDNTRFYVLDSHLNPLPAGVPGQLYVAGDGLARGYARRPGLTAEKFTPDPFSPAPGARMYQTGDLVRSREDGSLEYLGRIDQQVKLRGFRIELGEIEAQLLRHPQVRQALVTARRDAGREPRLVAYLVAAVDAMPEAAALQALLQQDLPDYMLPAHYVWMECLPLTPNGKIDRAALPAPDEAAPAAGQTAPRTPAEQLLAQIWIEVLGIAHVDVHDNFFDLGGHSLLATRIISRLRKQFQLDLPLRTLFESPTIELLARRIAEASASAGALLPPLTALPRDGAPPLSFAQQRLWFLQQLEPGNAFYHIPVAARLDGPLDVAHFAAALNAVVARHEALRTSFPVIDGTPVQHIADSLTLPLPLTDLAHLADADRQAEMLATEHAAIPFDLASGPLLNARLLRLAPQRHVLLLSMHHIIADGWSMSVLAREIALLYGALTEGRPSPLPPLTIQYADFALWQRHHLQGETLQRQLAYWSAQLAGSPPLLALPTRGPRPAVQRHAGSTHTFYFKPELSAALARLGRQHGATLFMTLLAALQLLLARYSGQRDIVVGSPVANRHHAELEPLIGFFVNTLALRGHIDPNDSFAALLAQVRATTLDAYAHQDLPFEQVVDALGLPRRLDHAPLFQVMFVLQNTPEVSLRAGELHLSAAQAAAANSAKFDLTLSMSEQDGIIQGLWEFNTDLFDPAAIDALDRHFAHLLEQACADPLRPLRQYTLYDASDTGRLRASRSPSRPTELSVITLFERQADATPNAPAVQCGQRTLSYAALDAHANALAQRLLAHGASPDQLIGVCLERSLHTVIAMLAIMKAGAACLPLDPAYPPERLAYMLTDAGVRLLLTEPALRARLPDSAQHLLLSPEPAPMAEPAIRPMKAINPQQLAYCIYTSGSTGRPKGVAVPHHGLGNMILAQIAEFGVRADDRVLQFASTSFDASVSEIFMTLLAGATLVLRPPHTLLGDELAAELTAQRITVATLPPALLRQMAPDACPTLRVLIAAGEACKPQDLAPWRERQCYNAYGPSEFTVCASIHAYIGEAQAASVSIGLPIANTEAYVLDAAWQPVPAGVAGELCLGGAGLARGYLQRPGLTAERFVPHPYAHGQRLYRTGDLARFCPDGQLEFLDRLDHQVKIRGFRIETGEVEAQLLRYPGLRQAAVLARDDRNGHPQLLAYVAGDTLTPQALREHLRQALPEYMLPAHLLILPSLPQTPNGKLDRAALPSPDELTVQSGTPYAAPQTPAELLLAQLWSEVLGVERVGLHDNFFELGGHSLLATTLLARINQQLSISLSISDVFLRQTPKELAAYIDLIQRQPPKLDADTEYSTFTI